MRDAGLVLLIVLTRAATGQEPQLATLVQPLSVPFEECKTRVQAELKAAGYTGLLESGNGWMAHARGTSASLTCIPQGGRTMLVIVTAGGQLVRESKRLFESIRGPEPAPRPAPELLPPAPPSEAVASGWDATAALLAGHPGSRYNFWCPPGGQAHPVWGDRLYSSDSSVCTAAAHAGTLSLDRGGNAIIEMRLGEPAYSSSTRNGIATLARGPANASFAVVAP